MHGGGTWGQDVAIKSVTSGQDLVLIGFTRPVHTVMRFRKRRESSCFPDLSGSAWLLEGPDAGSKRGLQRTRSAPDLPVALAGTFH